MSIIHLEDIELRKIGKYENCYVKLEPDKKEKLFSVSINLLSKKSLSSLARLLDIPLHKLSDSKNRNPIPISVLRKLSNFLVLNNYSKFSLRNLEKSVEYIKGTGQAIKIMKPKFPFDFQTNAGVRIISKLFHDGGIGKSREPHYHNQNLELIEEFCSDIRNVFGNIQIKVQNKTEKTRKYTVELPRLIGDILEKTGCFLGTKVENEVSPPEWLLGLKEEKICHFLRSAMDDEGSVSIRGIALGLAFEINSKLPEEMKNLLIKLSQHERTTLLREYLKRNESLKENCTSQILLFDKKLLTKIGIKVFGPYLSNCYLDKKNEKIRTFFNILLTGKSNLGNFGKIIGFKLKYKKEKLTLYLNKTRNVAPKKEAISNFIRMTLEVQNENDYCTDFLMAKRFGYNDQYLGMLRRQIEKNGLIKRIGRDWHKIKYITSIN